MDSSVEDKSLKNNVVSSAFTIRLVPVLTMLNCGTILNGQRMLVNLTVKQEIVVDNFHHKQDIKIHNYLRIFIDNFLFVFVLIMM